MFAPIVLFVMILYWICVHSLKKKSRVFRSPGAQVFLYLLFVFIFFGDHIIGYLLHRWSYIVVTINSKQAPKITKVEYRDFTPTDDAREKTVGHLPIEKAIGALRKINAKKIKYIAPSSMNEKAYDLMSNGISAVIVVDANKPEYPSPKNTNGILYGIYEKGSKYCNGVKINDDALYSNIIFQKNAADANSHCIGRKAVDGVAGDYVFERRLTDYHNPLHFPIFALFGVHLSQDKMYEKISGDVVWEARGSVFYGGWVWQMLTWFPNELSEVSRFYVSTDVDFYR